MPKSPRFTYAKGSGSRRTKSSSNSSATNSNFASKSTRPTSHSSRPRCNRSKPSNARRANGPAVSRDARRRHQAPCAPRDLLKQKMIAASLLDEAIAQESAAEIEYQNHVRALADFPNRINEQMARIARSEAELAQARIDLDHTTIRAPFAGPVLAVLASPATTPPWPRRSSKSPTPKVSKFARRCRTAMARAYAPRLRPASRSPRRSPKTAAR